MKLCDLALWLALSITPLPLSAQEARSATGVVNDPAGAPIAGATISLRAEHGIEVASTQSMAEGRFTLATVEPGRYVLTATHDGFAEARVTVALPDAAARDIVLTLALATTLETVVVTAARNGVASLQTLPMSVAALSGRELTEIGARTIEDVSAVSPWVRVSQFAGFAQVSIRGIGTNAVYAGSDPSSVVYLDGVYLARPAMALTELLDLERVEIVRGPQGTLYGRNAVGGAINLVSRAPASVVQFEADTTLGPDEMRAAGRVSGPLGSRVLGSIALLRGVRRGFVTDVDHPDHRLGGEDVSAGRGQVQWAPGPRASLHIAADIGHDDANPLAPTKVLLVKPGFTIDNPAGARRVRTSTLADGRQLHRGGSARLNFALTPTTTLTSLTAARGLDHDVSGDTDLSELVVQATRADERQHQFSQELTVSQHRARVSWVGGLFFFDERDRQTTTVQLLSQGLVYGLDGRVDASARAVFGQASLLVLRGVTLTGGLRYSDESKSMLGSGVLRSAATGQPIAPSAFAFLDHASWQAWTPRFAIDSRLSDRTLLYASAARGFKTGGFNATATEAGRGFGPEWAWMYETGVKHDTAGGRLRVNASAFHTDYTGLQVQTYLRPGVIDVRNAAEATIQGIEIEAAARMRDVQIGWELAWLNARYDRYDAIAPEGTRDVAGHWLNNAPEWAGRVWSDWVVLRRAAGSFRVRADASWQTTVYYSPLNDAIERQPAYGLLQARASFDARGGRWSVAAYCRNVTDTGYITGTFAAPPTAIGGRPGPPRRVGIDFSLRR